MHFEFLLQTPFFLGKQPKERMLPLLVQFMGGTCRKVQPGLNSNQALHFSNKYNSHLAKHSS